MRRLIALFAVLTLAVAGLVGVRTAAAQGWGEPENLLVMTLRSGEVLIQMRPDLAPNHVARIRQLVRARYYDNAPFHRVIPGFMAQTGDPTGTGMGGSGVKLKAEFTAYPHSRGVVSMARASDPNSADSQFFIMLAETPSLNNQYTVWGRVVSGMEHIDAIKQGDPRDNGKVTNPDRIISLRVRADLP